MRKRLLIVMGVTTICIGITELILPEFSFAPIGMRVAIILAGIGILLARSAYHRWEDK